METLRVLPWPQPHKATNLIFFFFVSIVFLFWTADIVRDLMAEKIPESFHTKA